MNVETTYHWHGRLTDDEYQAERSDWRLKVNQEFNLNPRERVMLEEQCYRSQYDFGEAWMSRNTLLKAKIRGQSKFGSRTTIWNTLKSLEDKGLIAIYGPGDAPSGQRHKSVTYVVGYCNPSGPTPDMSHVVLLVKPKPKVVAPVEVEVEDKPVFKSERTAAEQAAAEAHANAQFEKQYAETEIRIAEYAAKKLAEAEAKEAARAEFEAQCTEWTDEDEEKSELLLAQKRAESTAGVEKVREKLRIASIAHGIPRLLPPEAAVTTAPMHRRRVSSENLCYAESNEAWGEDDRSAEVGW